MTKKQAKYLKKWRDENTRSPYRRPDQNFDRRMCLGTCGKYFQSWGPANRLCKVCESKFKYDGQE